MIGERRLQIAKELGIEQTKVASVIKTYTEVCILHLKRGITVNFFGLARIEPCVKQTSFVGTTAYYALAVSEIESLSYNTTLSILKYFQKSIQMDIIKYRKARIPRLLTFNLVHKQDGTCTLQTSTSKSLCDKLRTDYTTPVRTHTSKLFRDYVIKNLDKRGFEDDK